MPGPNGPSRSTVGGTMSQPMAQSRTYAATSRNAKVPSGKSHSGRSPAIGLCTQAAVMPSSVTVQYNVALDASYNLPSTDSSPSRNRRNASGTSETAGSVIDVTADHGGRSDAD